MQHATIPSQYKIILSHTRSHPSMMVIAMTPMLYYFASMRLISLFASRLNVLTLTVGSWAPIAAGMMVPAPLMLDTQQLEGSNCRLDKYLKLLKKY